MVGVTVSKASQLLLLELNEISFNHLRSYISHGKLPHLAKLSAEYGISETTSELDYEKLEPWIQWVTAHTGLTFAEHGVFRLGDIVNHDVVQIWEWLEETGLKVGAISPMNASHRTRNAAFFVPDPWTKTGLTARYTLRRLYEAISQAVQDNAQARMTPMSAFWLIAGILRYARVENYVHYARLMASAISKPWVKAMLLDQLLSDVFIRETKRTCPNFATLFLNGGAHIQHHYMFNSAAYQGKRRNPHWYVNGKADPVLDVYELYDRIVGQILNAFPDARIMLATGLHQEPHDQVTFYWRLKDHEAFLRQVGVAFKRVEPRMSRDFLIVCESPDAALTAQRILSTAMGQDGVSLFEVDNRGADLFVMLTYPKDIADGFSYSIGGRSFTDFRSCVSFVAIKNGEHSGIGFFLDTGAKACDTSSAFPLQTLPARICAVFGVPWKERRDRAPEPISAG